MDGIGLDTVSFLNLSSQPLAGAAGISAAPQCPFESQSYFYRQVRGALPAARPTSCQITPSGRYGCKSLKAKSSPAGGVPRKRDALEGAPLGGKYFLGKLKL